MSCWEDISRHLGVDAFWMADPRVRRRIDLLISGDPDCHYPITWFARRMKDELPFGRVLSVGCGTGGLERHLVSLGAAGHITAIDNSTAPLEYARKAAAEAGIADRVSYERADAHEFIRRSGEWDAILFHASLHHLDSLPELFALIRERLKPGGIFFFDEYLGPSRHEWNWRRMIIANLVYQFLPRSVRRTKIIRMPVTDEDLTEMIRASAIGPLTRRHFEILEWRDYGGNLLSLIYPSLRRPAPGDERGARDFDRALDRLFGVENLLLRYPRLTRSTSFHAVVIARR